MLTQRSVRLTYALTVCRGTWTGKRVETYGSRRVDCQVAREFKSMSVRCDGHVDSVGVVLFQLGGRIPSSLLNPSSKTSSQTRTSSTSPSPGWPGRRSPG